MADPVETSKTSSPQPHELMKKSIEDVGALLSIHTRLTGKGPGKRSKVEVLNKSAIMLLVACWEAFVEDLVDMAFDRLLKNAKDKSLFENTVLASASTRFDESKNPLRYWEFAGDGWKSVLTRHKTDVCDEFNSPSPAKVDILFKCVLGIRHMSSTWDWPGTSAAKSKKRLLELVRLRGEIAHRVKARRPVGKRDVMKYALFINHIAVETSNTVRRFLMTKLKTSPWPEYSLPPRRPQKKSEHGSPLPTPQNSAKKENSEAQAKIKDRVGNIPGSY